MDSDAKTVLPHADNLEKENTAVGSDRVQAPVADAGSTDCGGSQTSNVANQAGAVGLERLVLTVSQMTSADKQKHSLLELVKRQDDLLFSLSEFLKGKSNVHKEIHRKVASMTTNWRRITELGGIEEAVYQPKTVAAANTQTTPTLKQQAQQQDENYEMVIEETPKARCPVKVKRGRDRLTPQSTEHKKKKRKSYEKEPQSEEPSTNGDENSEEKWQEAKKKRRPRKDSQTKPCEQPRKQRGRPAMPNALIVQKKDEGMSYAEILSHIRNDNALKGVSTSVQKVRRTNTGSLLLVLTKESAQKVTELHQVIQKAIGENATVKSKVQEFDVELKDMDEITTKEEVANAIQRDLGADSASVTLASIRSMRPAYNGTQTAVVRLLAPVAKKLLERKSIRIGWTYCRIRELVRPLKCFKCWNFGHLSRSCKSEVDRTKSCMKCGGEGHKVSECSANAHCVLCASKGGKDHLNHIAGSSRCPEYAQALLVKTKHRK